MEHGKEMSAEMEVGWVGTVNVYTNANKESNSHNEHGNNYITKRGDGHKQMARTTKTTCW